MDNAQKINCCKNTVVFNRFIFSIGACILKKLISFLMVLRGETVREETILIFYKETAKLIG
jgi:hypothetical protein